MTEQILLSSSTFSGLREVGGFGQPLHALYPQIRTVLLSEAGPEVAELLAEPVVDRVRGRIDWYIQGDPAQPRVLISALPELERQAWLDQVHGLLARGREVAERYLAADDPRRAQLGVVLRAALSTPAPEDVFVLEQRPVMIRWGFLPDGPWGSGAPEAFSVAPGPAAMAATAAPSEATVPDIAIPEVAIPEAITAAVEPASPSVEPSEPGLESKSEPAPIAPESRPGPGATAAPLTAESTAGVIAEPVVTQPADSWRRWGILLLILLLLLLLLLWWWWLGNRSEPPALTDPGLREPPPTVRLDQSDHPSAPPSGTSITRNTPSPLPSEPGSAPVSGSSESSASSESSPVPPITLPAPSTPASRSPADQTATTPARPMAGEGERTSVATRPATGSSVPGSETTSTTDPTRSVAEPNSADLDLPEVVTPDSRAGGRDPSAAAPDAGNDADQTASSVAAGSAPARLSPTPPAARTDSRSRIADGSDRSPAVPSAPVTDRTASAPNLEDVLADRAPAASTAPAAQPSATTLSEAGARPEAVSKAEPTPEEQREFADRVAKTGAATGEITVTLLWNGRSDLDLVVMCPSGQQLDYRNPAACGGALDVDANTTRANLSDRPVENAFWPASRAVPGDYKIAVRYSPRKDEPHPALTPFQVRLIRGGEESVFKGLARPGAVTPVTSFTVAR